MTERRNRRIRKRYNRIRRAHRVRSSALRAAPVLCRDRQLRPITAQGAELLLRMIRARRVALTTLRQGYVSTVATIIDVGVGRPLYFETMTRGAGPLFDDARWSAPTERDALRAHASVVIAIAAAAAMSDDAER